MDTDEIQLQEYEMQLEQVEIALKSDGHNDELLKLQADLLEIITLTKEIIKEGDVTAKNKNIKGNSSNQFKSGDKVMAPWRVDGKYYSATIDQILEDGTCTVIFDGYSTTEISQLGLLMTRNKNSTILSNDHLNQANKTASSSSQVGHKKAFTKKELELKLKEAKKRKKEKFALKLKAMEEISEKEKNKWKNFNTKLAAKTWKGVVKKSKFETPDDHELKIGVGTNSASNRLKNGTGSFTSHNSSATAASKLISKSKTNANFD